MKCESPAVARNREPIASVLKLHCSEQTRVLEIASGTGEHALYLSSVLRPELWQPTDLAAESIASINAWRQEAKDVTMCVPAKQLDVCDVSQWPEAASYHAIVCINMVHISPWQATEKLFCLANHSLVGPDRFIFLYGPYLEKDRPTAPSNLAFDQSLKARNPAWGIRYLHEVDQVAEEQGWQRSERYDMPANNLSLIYKSSASI